MKAVLWDMDGVLIDSERYYWQEMDALYEDMGVFLPHDKKVTFVGSSAMINTGKVKNWYPDLKYTAEELCELHVAALIRGLKRVTEIIPGARRWVDTLHKLGVKSAVATSSVGEMLDYARSTFKLDNIFDTIVTGSDVPRAKPNPDIFLEAARRCGATPAECVVIEDSQNGVLAAHAAGIKVAVFTGAPGLKGAPIPEGGDFYFDDYTDAAFASVQKLSI